MRRRRTGRRRKEREGRREERGEGEGNDEDRECDIYAKIRFNNYSYGSQISTI
jgi:hypothetical protein